MSFHRAMMVVEKIKLLFREAPFTNPYDISTYMVLILVWNW